MAQQSLLPGFEPEPTPTDRVFFALMPDEAAIAQVGQRTRALREAYPIRGRAIDTRRLHISLNNLGDHPAMPERLVARACAAAATLALPPFRVSLDQALTFSNKSRVARHRPLVLRGDDGVAGVHALHQALSKVLLAAGLPGAAASFTPHLTMLYDDLLVPPHAVAPVEWTAHSFVLLHSLIGHGGPYTVLGQWPLRA